MEYFNTLPEEVQKKAYENLAYELLDSYLKQHDPVVSEERLMQCLENETQPYLNKWYSQYKEITK
jgi:Fe-S cluster biosynthesis and repair protein YggX